MRDGRLELENSRPSNGRVIRESCATLSDNEVNRPVELFGDSNLAILNFGSGVGKTSEEDSGQSIGDAVESESDIITGLGCSRGECDGGEGFDRESWVRFGASGDECGG